MWVSDGIFLSLLVEVKNGRGGGGRYIDNEDAPVLLTLISAPHRYCLFVL